MTGPIASEIASGFIVGSSLCAVHRIKIKKTWNLLLFIADFS